jgi:CRP/FNR family transcriptional regulator, anaerobic regulatory protein
MEENQGCQHHPNHCGGNGSRRCISIVPIFNHLEENQMDEVMGTVRHVSFKKGEIIYRQGETSESLYVVHSGKVRIYRLSESGKEQIVRILNPGDFTGELALFKEDVHESFAEAMVNTDICLINRDDLQEFLMKYPTISLKILTEFSNRLEESEKQTTRFATEKVETRIAMFLAECLEKDQESTEIELPMAKKDLASYLGTTPETLSRKLTELEAEGYIKQKTNKVIDIVDLDGLLFV